jgi:hypothetical protein
MFELDILEVKDFEITKSGVKTFYNLDQEISLGEWTIKTQNGFAYLVSHNNNVMKSIRDVYYSSEPVTNGTKTFAIGVDNFYYIICNFTARKLVLPTWINDKDEFCAPKSENKSFYQDGIIYSLFNNSSYQKSTGESKNEFFWMSKNQMKELSNQYGYDNLHNDARTSSDRHVYKLLFGDERIYDKLSPDAKLVLDKATELVEKSMELRQTMADDENHLDSWDAGYAQLKLIWKVSFPEEFKEFRQLYKNLEDRMRPLVYELGFLMK